jgi:integrase
MKWTDTKIKAIKPKSERFIEWEPGETGLGLRISPAGRKSFIYMYRYQGRPRMMTLGPYPRIGLARARRMASESREQLTHDIDPGAEHTEKKRQERGAPTIRTLAEEYLNLWAKPRKKSWKEDERIIQKDVIPTWGRLKAKNLKRRDILLLIDSIIERGSPISANRTLAVIRRMLNFAVERGIIDATPCVSIKAPGKENRRDRILSESEIRQFWKGLEKTPINNAIQLVLRFQLVTGQRKGEIVTALWDEINDGWWTIPKEKSKNGLPHRVPIPAMAKTLLSEIKTLAGDSPWLFPSQRRKGRHLTQASVDHALRLNLDSLKIKGLTPHDLRRTAASMISGLGVERTILKKILNHVDGDITGVYDLHGYDKEKRQALDEWSRKLESILIGKKGKILPLKKRKK